MTPTFVDLHHHFLWGIDDGPREEAGMYRMLDQAAADGIRVLAATPHITPGVHPFPWDQYRTAFSQASAYCRAKHPSLQLCAGAEILYTEHTCRLLQEGQVPTLNASRYVLVEFSPDDSFERLQHAADELLSSGFWPVLAHAERYECLLFSLKKVEVLRNRGMLMQINARSLLRPRSFFQKRMIRRMLDHEMVDLIATDAHNLTSRGVCMTQVWQSLETRYHADVLERLMCRGLFTPGSFD